MTHNISETKIRQLLARFMEGQTTLQEEDSIARWFMAHPTAAPDLEPYRAMFGYFRRGMPLDEPLASALVEEGGAPAPCSSCNRSARAALVAVKRRRTTALVLSAAAAVAVVLMVAWPKGHGPVVPVGNAPVAVAAADTARTPAPGGATALPEQGVQPVQPAVQPACTRSGRRRVRRPVRQYRRFVPAPPPVYMAGEAIKAFMDEQSEHDLRQTRRLLAEQDSMARRDIESIAAEERMAREYMARMLDDDGYYDDNDAAPSADCY